MAAQFGRRLRRGATSGAIVAAAVAALAASQGPGALPPPTDNLSGDSAIGAGDATTTPGGGGGGSATGDSPYYTDLPPLNTPNRPGVAPTAPTVPIVTGPAEAGIPATVLAAYRRAEASVRASDPSCNLPWQLLAGIGKVESGQARGGRVDGNGTTLSPILGPALDGNGFALIQDTDRGAFDGDTTHDRAVGPMQFIPSTWAVWGQDANGDGKKDPNNIYDAAQAAGMYLCAGGRNLAIKADLDRAILSYNRSTEYLTTVLTWFEYYGRGTHTVPDGTGQLPVDRSDRFGPDRPLRPTAPTSPSPSTTPTPDRPSPKPTNPAPTTPPKPTEPTKPPTTEPTRPPVGTPVEIPPTLRVARLKPGTAALTAVTESTFAQAATVTAVDAAGRPVAGVSVRFELPATTDARFPAGATTVTVTSDARGVAKAPALRAGEKAEPFTIRASVPGRSLTAELKATVEVRKADALARVGDAALTATTGGDYAEVTVEGRLDGALAPGVTVTAVVTDSADSAQQSADGPSFGKDAAGNPIRTKVLKTDANGRLSIKGLVAGEKAGSYVLLLTAPGGGTAKLTLTVTEPVTTPPASPDPTTDPAPTASESPSAPASPSGSASASPSVSTSPTA
ncbi:lytic transglycosylase domain-containing protein [Streptomyces sp. G2]|uniref:lytic transglycosylase domain-containing protein n=1 Tax=Streptomyces sp. G2 TaxID=1684471 RepID=UPI002030354B|nr:lytic transglycosylase domain-containing protein [Streptomyces sp. G2]MCM1948842.1 lytic transglycosylase domain-containing protein [Streptomyces sp. G2]